MADLGEGDQERRSTLAKWGPLLALSIAMFIVVLDTTMMNVAVTRIAHDLNTTVDNVQAAIALFAMVMASLMLTAGKLADIKGSKRMFSIGIVIYGFGTFLAAISWSMGVLTLGWSVIEGIAAALLMPLAFTLIYVHYSGGERALAFGVLGGLMAVGAAVGPILGGILTTFLSWRWGFGLELIGVFMVLPLLRTMREAPRDETATMDWVGTVFAILMGTLIVTGIILAPTYGFFAARRPFFIGDVQFNPLGLSPTAIFLAAGFLFVGLFVSWQRRRERRGLTPLIRLHLFRNRGYVAAISTGTAQAMAMYGFLFVIPVFLQNAGGYTAFDTGLSLVPFSLATLVVSLTTANLGRRIPSKYLIIPGYLLMALGVALMTTVTSTTVTIVEMVVPNLVFGVGTGLVLGQIVNLTLSLVRKPERNEASGARGMTQQIGASLGTAVIGALLLTGVYGGIVDGVLAEVGLTVSPEEREQLIIALEDKLREMSPEEIEDVISRLPPDDQARLLAIVEGAQVKAQQAALVVTVAIIVLAFIVSLFLPARKLGEEEAAEGLAK